MMWVLTSAGVAAADPSAPAADDASGIEVAAPTPRYWTANTLLAVPRAIGALLLRGPRYATAGIDSYLEGRSPDVNNRTVSKSGWRLGAEVTGETELGASVALRVGYKFKRRTTIDVWGGLFGPRGESGALRLATGSYTSVNLEPSVTVDAGHEMGRIVGDTRYEADEYGVIPTLTLRIGAVRFKAGVRFDRITNDAIDTIMMSAGSGETERAATEELSIVYDDRRRTHAWVNEGTHSTGFYVRAAVAYIHGEGSRSGEFSTGRGSLEVRRLFDLFHGDRVLTLGVRAEAITDPDVPFDRMPSLGGSDRMRAFARDELRARRLGFALIEYEWALGADSRAYVFTEAAGSGSSDSLVFDAGLGVRLLTMETTSVRAQAAISDDGDFGFLLQLGVL